MPQRAPDKKHKLGGQGQAALWLGESLILALLESNLLEIETILEAIDIVIGAKKAKAAKDNAYVCRAALTQLASISASIAAAKATSNQAGVEPRPRSRQRRSPS